MMQANEVISSALHRQPLVVGYSRTPKKEDEYRNVGWVLGPRFKVEQDARGRPEFGFRHRIVQNTLNAEIAVPQLASGLEVVMCGGWREREAATTAGGAGECPAGMTVIGRETVFLPQNRRRWPRPSTRTPGAPTPNSTRADSFRRASPPVSRNQAHKRRAPPSGRS
jgi:hypothetical protein